MSIGNKKLIQEYLYDFAVDGGGNGANIVLSSKAGSAVLPTGAIITAVTAHCLTNVAGTSSTISWGNDTADGYSGTTIAEATFTENYVMDHRTVGASHLWDDSNDHDIPYRVAGATTGVFNFLISVADLTAGKIRFFVEYIMPSEV